MLKNNDADPLLREGPISDLAAIMAEQPEEPSYMDGMTSYDCSCMSAELQNAAHALHALDPKLLRFDGRHCVVDWPRALNVHHARIPVTVAFLSALDSRMAEVVFSGQDYSLPSVLALVPSMDSGEAAAVAALGGIAAPADRTAGRNIFFDAVERVIERRGMQRLFRKVGGYVQFEPSRPMAELAKTKGLDATTSILLATVCGLYNGDLAKECFKGRSRVGAVEAVHHIESEQTEREDFYRLIAYYSGW